MKTIEVDKKEIDHWNRLLDLGDRIDFEKEGVEEDSTLFLRTVKFEDGCFADLKVCSGQNNLWSEMVWFTEDGCQFNCTVGEGPIYGLWEFESFDDDDELRTINARKGMYDVKVVTK